MTAYLCNKYESNAPIFSKDIKWKPFFKVVKKGETPIIIGGFYSKLNLYFMITGIYPCTKYESNALIFSKDIKWKLFFEVEKGL